MGGFREVIDEQPFMGVGGCWRWIKKEDMLEPNGGRLDLGVSLGPIGKTRAIKGVALHNLQLYTRVRGVGMLI